MNRINIVVHLLAQYPDAKFSLIDTGLAPDGIIAILVTHKIHGILSFRAELHLFEKALEAVSDGQLWIADRAMKSLLAKLISLVTNSRGGLFA
jgi:hypothetical protein